MIEPSTYRQNDTVVSHDLLEILLLQAWQDVIARYLLPCERAMRVRQGSCVCCNCSNLVKFTLDVFLDEYVHIGH
jgi:hypothetical protein